MHELGVIRAALRTLDTFCEENNIQEIDTLVLQIGELSGVIASYLEELYPAAVYQTKYEKMKLKIEEEEGVAVCRDCKRAFNVIKNEGRCPRCGKKNADVISGRTFMIKEILIP